MTHGNAKHHRPGDHIKGATHKKEPYNMNKSKIIGFMLLHTDGDKEFYTPQLSAEDQQKIYKILKNTEIITKAFAEILK